MHSKRIRILVGILTVCFLTWMSAYAQGDKTKVKGLITARTGDTIVLKTTDGTTMTVTLDDDTKVQQPKGAGSTQAENVCCCADSGPQGLH